jgi:cell division protein FtsL
MLRVLHIVVLAALVLAAADVYKIKYESTQQAERVGKLRADIRREQDTIALLRAEGARLERPDRIQDLTNRHLKLKLLDARQLDALDRLPERPAELVPPGTADPIGAVIEGFEDLDAATGSITPRGAAR